MQVGDHYCGIYRTEGEHRALVVDFIREGVRRREKMFYIVNVHTAAELKHLLDQDGLDAEALTESGQLMVLTAKEAYMREGEFDPDSMIALLRAETALAEDQGYPALRVTAEMSWALAGEPGSERLIEYESKLNEFFPRSNCYAICQYDRRRFDSEVLMDVLHTHPHALIGVRGFDNRHMYYVPPRAFLSADRQSAMLERWLANLGEQGIVASLEPIDGAQSSTVTG
jgi:hypothetical protein